MVRSRRSTRTMRFPTTTGPAGGASRTSRSMIVQASTSSCSRSRIHCTLDAVAALGPNAGRGDRRRRHHLGSGEPKLVDAVGAAACAGPSSQASTTTPEGVEPAGEASRCASLASAGWMPPATKIIKVRCPSSSACPSPIVFDHLTRVREATAWRPALRQVLALMDKAGTWVELCRAYGEAKVGPPTYADTARSARLREGGAERMGWGSDSPRPTEKDREFAGRRGATSTSSPTRRPTRR